MMGGGGGQKGQVRKRAKDLGEEGGHNLQH